MSTAAELKPFTAEHYDAARTLWLATPGAGLSSADERHAIEAFLARNPGLSSVAMAGEQLVGTLLCGHDGRRGYIHHLAVAPDARHQGLARALVQAALQGLAALGIAKCHLMVFVENREGRAFWRALGAAERVELSLFSLPTPLVAP